MYSYRRLLEARNFAFRERRNCTIRVAKTKALISFAVTAKLICVFVFAYADCWFSCAAAHIVHLIIQRHAICMDDINAIKAYKIPLISVQGVTANMCMQVAFFFLSI